MNFFKNLKKFDDAINSAKNKKEEIKELTDKSKRTEEDIKNIRKSKLWSFFNMLLIIGFCVGLFFVLKLTFSVLIVGVILYVVIGNVVISMLLKKCSQFTKENAPDLGAHFFVKFNTFFLIIGLISAVMLKLLTLGVF